MKQHTNIDTQSHKGALHLVVGGSEGIGLALAEILSKQCGSGDTLIIASRSKTKLDEAFKSLKSSANKELKIAAYTVDVSKSQDCQALCQTILKDHRTPTHIYNCAGLAHPGFIDQLDLSKFDEMIDINLKGTYYLCNAFVPSLKKQGFGNILNTSSMAGFLGLFGYTGYCASKFGVIGFSEALRRELAPFNINVSTLCPPNTKTPGLDRENLTKPAEVLATEEKAKVLTANQVAQETLKGLKKKKSIIVPSFDGKAALNLSRWAPIIMDKILARKDNHL